MWDSTYITALILGIGGGFHCIGMCGPIALVLPVHRQNKLLGFIQTVLYHLGRIITYSILGLAFGWVGKGLYLAGFQQRVSILMGVIMILSVVFPTQFLNQWEPAKPMYQIIGKLKQYLGSFLKKKSSFAIFVIGILNGWLPCGLVYMALIAAIAMSNPISGAVYMVFFGIGTSVLLSVLIFAGNFISLSFRNKINKILPYFVILIGIVFILRGLGLGIPYLSPSDSKLELSHGNDAEHCSFHQNQSDNEKIFIIV